MNKKAKLLNKEPHTFSVWDVCYLTRRLVSDNPIWYKLYVHIFRRSPRGIFKPYFNPNINIYYDGYERSGNTFLSHLTEELLPDFQGEHHRHKIAPLKIALREKLPIFVIFRDPKDCISSKYLAHYRWNGKEIPLDKINLYQLRKYSYDYYYYYKFIEKLDEQIKLIHFNELVNNTTEVIFRMGEVLSHKLDDSKLNAKVQESFDAYKSDPSRYEKPMPNEKEKVRKELTNIDRYNQILDLYMRLKQSPNRLIT